MAYLCCNSVEKPPGLVAPEEVTPGSPKQAATIEKQPIHTNDVPDVPVEGEGSGPEYTLAAAAEAAASWRRDMEQENAELARRLQEERERQGKLKAEIEDLREKTAGMAPVKYVVFDARCSRGIEAVDSMEEVQEWMREASESEGGDMAADHTAGHWGALGSIADLDPHTNVNTITGSALGFRTWLQGVIYVLAFSGVVFVLVAKATDLGADTEGGEGSASTSACGTAGDHRRLGAGPPPLLVSIAYSLAAAGLITFVVNLFGQPLILGFLLGGVAVGSEWGMQIVQSHEEISALSSLGLIFLLFMIGLELDVSEVPKMGRTVVVTGLFQLPLCAGFLYGILAFLDELGMSFGEGDYAVLYCSVGCSISSTVIVLRALKDRADMDSAPGQLTIGILIFQDIWAVVVLAIQPDLAHPEFLEYLKTFGMIAVLIVVALCYAKFTMPAVFLSSSKNMELMLILALAWCFFMCCLAVLPFVELSMELAALISGVALATFPYSAEFNSKIKYIRDFFITLFFVGLGMRLPSPTFEPIAKAVVLAALACLSRWLGIWLVVWLLGGGSRRATVASLNLSQVSEFALVICTLGTNFGHVAEDTLTILIWAFMIMALLSSNVLLRFNYTLYAILSHGCHMCTGRGRVKGDTAGALQEEEGHVDRNIVILGFGKVAAMLIANFEHHSPQLLAKLHVIASQQHIMEEMRKRGITCASGDITSVDVLRAAHHDQVRLVICSIPDSLLHGATNLRLLKASKKAWPQADVIVTADSTQDANNLYEAGADYVVRMAKLCAERLHDLISDHATHVVHHQHLGAEMSLAHVFESYKQADQQAPPRISEVLQPTELTPQQGA